MRDAKVEAFCKHVLEIIILAKVDYLYSMLLTARRGRM